MADYSSISHERRNRISRKDLFPIGIEIEHASGIKATDPNLLTLACLIGEVKALRPGGAVSLISGRPAIIYRTDSLEIPLTTDEVERLVLRALTPAEFAILLEHFGMEHEWHEDFYDPETGIAMQPRGKYSPPQA